MRTRFGNPVQPGPPGDPDPPPRQPGPAASARWTARTARPPGASRAPRPEPVQPAHLLRRAASRHLRCHGARPTPATDQLTRGRGAAHRTAEPRAATLTAPGALDRPNLLARGAGPARPSEPAPHTAAVSQPGPLHTVAWVPLIIFNDRGVFATPIVPSYGDFLVPPELISHA